MSSLLTVVVGSQYARTGPILCCKRIRQVYTRDSERIHSKTQRQTLSEGYIGSLDRSRSHLANADFASAGWYCLWMGPVTHEGQHGGSLSSALSHCAPYDDGNGGHASHRCWAPTTPSGQNGSRIYVWLQAPFTTPSFFFLIKLFSLLFFFSSGRLTRIERVYRLHTLTALVPLIHPPTLKSDDHIHWRYQGDRWESIKHDAHLEIKLSIAWSGRRLERSKFNSNREIKIIRLHNNHNSTNKSKKKKRPNLKYAMHLYNSMPRFQRVLNHFFLLKCEWLSKFSS